MATVTPNFNWPVPTSTDLVKDGATAIEALGDSIDASLVDLKGGTTGQVLSKNSNTDMDFVWVTDAAGDITGVTAGTGISGGGTSGTVTVTNSMATAIDAKGDLVPGTGADTFARLAVGANGTVLTADSAEATGLKWASAGATSGPAFSAISAAEQLISANTNTKVTFGTEIFDTAGNFASSRFTPTTAGYYQINASLTLSSNSAGEFYGYFYKNGDRISRFSNSASALTNMTVSGGMVVAMNGSTDYLECYVAISNSGNPRIDSGSNQTQFSGVWIRGL